MYIPWKLAKPPSPRTDIQHFCLPFLAELSWRPAIELMMVKRRGKSRIFTFRSFGKLTRQVPARSSSKGEKFSGSACEHGFIELLVIFLQDKIQNLACYLQQLKQSVSTCRAARPSQGLSRGNYGSLVFSHTANPSQQVSTVWLKCSSSKMLPPSWQLLFLALSTSIPTPSPPSSRLPS